MRNLSRWDPFALVRRPEGSYRNPLFRTSDTLQTSHWAPALDLTEQPDAFEVSLEVPGLAPEEIEVSYERGTLVVRGEKKAGHSESDGSLRRVERSYGAFSRAVRIGSPIEVEQIQARYQDGVLSIRLPKAAEAQRHQVSINS